MISLQGILPRILLAALLLHMRANAETTISPKEVIINGSDDEARRCFTCNTTQQEIYWGVDGEYHTAEEVYLYEDQIVGTFCSNFTSNTTVTCFGESSAPNNSVSENDTGQVTFIDEAPINPSATVSTEPGNSVSTNLPTGTIGTTNTGQPTSKPPDSTLLTAFTVSLVIVVLVAVMAVCVVIALLCCRHRKRTRLKKTASTRREIEGGPSTGVNSSQDAVTHNGELAENGVCEPEKVPLSNEEKEGEKEETTLSSSAGPTSKLPTSPSPPPPPIHGEEEEEVNILAAADHTPPVNEPHSSSKPESFPWAQRAPLDLVKKEEEPSRIVETGRDSPNGNDGVPDGVMSATKELPDNLKTPLQVRSLPPVDMPHDNVVDSLTENVVEQPTSSMSPQHLPPELNTEGDSSSIQDGCKSPDQSPFSELVEGSHILGPQFNDTHNRQESSSLHTDPENSALIRPQRFRRPTSFGSSLKRTLEGNDTVDKNSIQDGCKSPDQSPFSELGEGSGVLGPQLSDSHGHQESSSLHTGVQETYSSPEPTSPKPPLHVQHLPLREKENK